MGHVPAFILAGDGVSEQGFEVLANVWRGTTIYAPGLPGEVTRVAPTTSSNQGFVASFNAVADLDWMSWLRVDFPPGGDVEYMRAQRTNAAGMTVASMEFSTPNAGGTVDVVNPDGVTVADTLLRAGISTSICALFGFDNVGDWVWTKQFGYTAPPTSTSAWRLREVVLTRDGLQFIAGGSFEFPGILSSENPLVDGFTQTQAIGGNGDTHEAAFICIGNVLTGLITQLYWNWDSSVGGSGLFGRLEGIAFPNIDGLLADAGFYERQSSGDQYRIDLGEASEIALPTGIFLRFDEHQAMVARAADLSAEHVISVSAQTGAPENSRFYGAARAADGKHYAVGPVDLNGGTVDLDRFSVSLPSPITQSTSNKLLTLALNNDGTELWTAEMVVSVSSTDLLRAMSCLLSPDDADLYLAVHWEIGSAGTVTFDPGGTPVVLTMLGLNEVFAGAYDAITGAPKWVRHAVRTSVGLDASVGKGWVPRTGPKVGQIHFPVFVSGLTGADTIDFGDGFVLTALNQSGNSQRNLVWRMIDNGLTVTTDAVDEMVAGGGGAGTETDGSVRGF